MNNELPNRQREMLELLGDGKPHTTYELHQLCHSQSKRAVVSRHISALRKHLRLKGLDIVCLNEGKHRYEGTGPRYRVVKLVSDIYGE